MQFVGVAWYGDERSFTRFVDEHGLTFPQISDPDGRVFARFGVASQPALVVVSPDGATFTWLGAFTDDELAELLSPA